MPLSSAKSVWLTLTLLFACLFVTPSECYAARKIRIHFVGASFTFARDTADNSQLASASSRAGYDAIWEMEVDQGFPTFFPTPKVRNATGLTQQRLKFGNGDCDGNLQHDTTPSKQPGASIYKYTDDLVAIKIPAPHAARMIVSDQPSPCSGPLFINYAPGAGVTTSFTPSQAGLPNDAGASVPPDAAFNAAFVVNPRDPGKVVNFSFVQTANFDNYESKSVWFGFVRVELDPQNQAPSPIDPLKLFNYTPPDPGQTPPDPPSPNNNGGGGPNPEPPTITIKDIKDWIKNPVIDKIKGALEALQQAWGAITGGKPAKLGGTLGAVYSAPTGDFIYDTDTRKLTLLSVADAPADGTASVSIGVGDGAQKSAGKGLAIQAEVGQQVTLTLPAALVKALNRGKKIPLKITGSFTSSGSGKNRKKGSVTSSVTIKKRG